MQNELIYGVYFFFLLVGAGLGMLIGFLIGYQTAQTHVPDFDEEWFAYEERRYPDRTADGSSAGGAK